MSSIPASRYLIYPVPWYSVLIVTGIILAIVLALRSEKRYGLPKDTVVDLALFVLPCGIIGARIYYVLFSWNEFRNDLWSVLRIWEGGIAIYGAIIGGLAALFVFCRRRKLSALLLCDLIAPGLALAQSIGRWGNWFNIEAFGLKVNNPSLCFFPLSVQVPADGFSWHLAAFFYESAWDFAIFLFLIITRSHKLKEKGDIILFYAFLYAAGRLLIEETRLDSLYFASSVRVSQLLSVLICAAVLFRYILIAWSRRALSHLVMYLLIPLSFAGTAFAFLYSVAGSLFSSFSAFQILLLLAISSCIMTICLFVVRFSPSYSREVTYADD